MRAGMSAGGFGTANAMMKFPEMFVSCAALSPAIYSIGDAVKYMTKFASWLQGIKP